MRTDHRLALSLALVSLSSACGASSAEPAPAATEPAQSGDDEVAPPAASSPGYVVHEWGLVDVDPQGVTELGAGPGNPPPTMSVRKPVLYVQLDPGTDALAFRAQVRVPGGSIVEHWPAGSLGEGTLEWPRVEARRCERGASRDMPAGESSREATRSLGRACDTPDGYCEVADLPGYVADGSACLRVGETDATLLFYRAAIPSIALPFELTRAADGSVTVRATRDVPAIVGSLWRLSSTPSAVTVSRADAPRSAGQIVTLAMPSAAAEIERDRAALAADLATHGLTRAEADAFLRAWTAELFTPSASRGPARRMPRREQILYWLPRDDVDRLAPLTITPPPRELRRAILVRVELG